MEGCDGTPGGSPSDLTVRRYDRFAAEVLDPLVRGNGCCPGRTSESPPVVDLRGQRRRFRGSRSPKQGIAASQFGSDHRPLTIMQLTHSGRYSRPVDWPEPIIAFRNPILDPRHNLSADYPMITDEELESLEDRFVAAARLAREAGFDGIDLKATHGYLVAELLAARTRAGRYGGSFENLTRFIRSVLMKVRERVPDLLLTVRLWAFDGLPHPYGWGMSENTPGREDLDEPSRLAKVLYDDGVRLLNVSAGNPYFNPHINRPFDQATRGGEIHKSTRWRGFPIFRAGRVLQEAEPRMTVMGTGYSWLRQFFPYAAAANLKQRMGSDHWCRA